MSGLWRNDSETPEGKYPIVLRRDGTVITKPYFVLLDCDPGFVDAMRAYANKHEEIGSDPDFVAQIRTWYLDVADNPPPQGDPDAPRHRKDDPVVIAWARAAHSASACILAALFLLLFAIPAHAQPSNIRVAANIGAAKSFGYSGCVCGATVGGDLRKGRFDFSGDFNVDHVRKSTGGSGYSVSGRETARVYFNKTVFAEGDFEQTYYNVRDYSKKNFFVGAGLGAFLSERVLVRGVFLTHAGEWSRPPGTPNNQNAVEGSVALFLRRHIYLRMVGTVSRFQSHPAKGITQQTATGAEFQIGVYK